MTVDSMIAEAEKSIGLGEPNKIQAWYSTKVNTSGWGSNWAWCDASITYWAWRSGNEQAVTFGGYEQYTVHHAERFRAHGQWHEDVAGIHRGDIVFFDWGHTDRISAIDHVGLVTGVRSDGWVETIEGNTSNECARRIRTAAEIAGYGRPAYKAATPPPPPHSVPAKPVVIAAGPWNDKQVTSTTKIVQRGLNAELGARLLVDGLFGPHTKAAYRQWQLKLGLVGNDADGIPGPFSLGKLGAKHGFDVR